MKGKRSLKIPAGLVVAAALFGSMLVCPAAAVAAANKDSEKTSAQKQSAVENSKNVALSDAVSDYQGLTVQDIRLPGVSAQDQKRLLPLIPQKIGQPLDRDQVRESIRTLYATGRFADIRVEGERSGGGAVLNFVTSANYFIGEVVVTGNPPRPSVSQVVNASKLQLGELFTHDKLDRALNNIQQLMQENGYYRSTVREQEVRHAETQQIGITFHITPGSQAHVGQVNVTGRPGYSEGAIHDIAHLHPGETVSAQHISNALDRLRKKYQKRNQLLVEVSVESRAYRPAANAVDFTLAIEPGPIVHIITEGFKVSRSVLKRNVPIYEENALDDDLLNEGRRNLVNYMQAKGYFDARVTVKKNSDPEGDEMRVIYDIDPGARHRVAGIEIAGNQYFDADQLRGLMQVQPAGRVLSRGRYSQGLLSDDVRTLEDLYRANGFEQVKITSQVTDNYRGQANQLSIHLQVSEGQQTLVEALHIVGNTTKLGEPFPTLNLGAGQPFSESRIADDRDIVLNYYFNRGFPDATFEASAKPIPNRPGRMEVTYTIQQGERVFIDRVLVSGPHYTRPFVIQRELQMKPGDAVSQIDLLKTQQQLYDLGIFSQVDTAVQNPDGTEPDKNVLVQVQEARRYTFNYGIGFEFETGEPTVGTNRPQGQTGVSPRVSFGVTRLNFRGTDDSITFSAHAGRLQQRGLLSYQVPHWFGSPKWKLTFTTFYDDTVGVTTFTSERLEGSVQAEQTIGKTSSMDYRFSYRRVLATNLEVSTDEIPLLSLPTRVGGPGFTYIRDHRDNALESTKGVYLTVDASVASSYFGSEADFSRILVQHSTYYAFGKKHPQEKKFVFARSTRVGAETPFGTSVLRPPGECPQTAGGPVECLPLPELFFSGGGNSHRGFGLNQAGPRDPQTGFPLGGGALFLNNLELRFPPMELPFFQDNLSFALFHDAGNVFTNGTDMLHSLFRWHQSDPQRCLQESTHTECSYNYISHAIGLGVHYKTPIGPVRFDFGYNLNPPAYPSFQTITLPSGKQGSVFSPQHLGHFNVFFSVGQTF